MSCSRHLIVLTERVCDVTSIEERLDRVRNLIQDEDFLTGKGLSNEVNIRIFCYKPEDEMVVRHFVKQIKSDQSLRCNLVERNLYEVFLSACEDIGIIEEIPEMEERYGSAYLLKQLYYAVGNEGFVERIAYEDQALGDVLLLTGVGEVFPFMRIHVLLAALQPHFTHTPILVMYPGTFDGRHVRLFDKLEPNDYYRAFNLI